jgi:DNA-directed DNA polymerase III PolC
MISRPNPNTSGQPSAPIQGKINRLCEPLKDAHHSKADQQMETTDIVHLRAHSNYSFLEGIPSPRALAMAAAQHGMSALALTDHYGLTGSIEFYLACPVVGVKPILGLDIPIQHPLGLGELTFLAMDLSGWQSLCKLSSALLTSQQRDPSEGISWDHLEANSGGLLCLSGGFRGLAWTLLDHGRSPDAERLLNELAALFSQRLYVELQIHQPRDRQIVIELSNLAERHSFPVVATHSVYYLDSAQAELARTLAAMRLNKHRNNLEANELPAPEAHFISPEMMARRFSDFPEALATTQIVAERCQLELPLDQPHYPEIQLPPGKTAQNLLRERAEAGAKQQYGEITPEIRQRLEHELVVIEQRGYAPLFLIVQDLLEHARKTAVPVSSRGSAASSLVAHCLGLTSPDPLALNLYFERFLNPARSSPPDIDIDLCSTRREGVIKYAYERYGHDRVAMVATINRFRRRSALREVAKAFGLPAKEIKTMAEQLPWRGWGPYSAHNSPGEDPYADLRRQYPSPRNQAVFDQAAAVLEYPRHLSIHPGGIVISPEPINHLVPTHLASKGVVITQLDLESIERLGLIKIDLLGIRGLSVLGDVSEKIYSWRRSEFTGSLEVLDAIPDDDPDTAKLVREARTIGCFQIESPGMRLTLREIEAHSPDDIMIALALYRPGPLTGGLKDAFVRRHLGKERVEHLHPALKDLLADTHGVILYQEQVLRIASELAGLSLTDADLLRRAMSHFDPGERMKTLKQRFMEGALRKSGVPAERSEMIWDLMAAFAGYGFPKAHAASYAQVAWRSAWCKAHHPAEFMAAVLANWGGYYPQRIYLNEARRMGLDLRPPHINHAGSQFRVSYHQGVPAIYMGLGQVSALTRKTLDRILTRRPFSSLEDFLTRADPRPLEAENLIKVGALRGLGTIPALLSRVSSGKWQYLQPALFDLDTDADNTIEWSLAQRVAAQRSILGASLDAHPLELLDPKSLATMAPVSSSQALEKIGEQVRMIGIRQTLQRVQGSGGEPFYALEMEDLEGIITVLVHRDLYNRHRSVLFGREPLVIEGKIEFEPKLGEAVLLAQRIWRISS